MARYLSAREARRFYDRFGARQDAQGFYENAALTALAAHAGLEDAQNVFEFGCGTGRLAEQILTRYLPANARYWACDLSGAMVALARGRLARFGARVRLWRADATADFGPDPVSDSGPDSGPDFPPVGPPFDVILSSYVLDLLPPDQIAAMLAKSARSLRAGGRLGLVSLGHGRGVARLTSGLWTLIARFRPALVGGCRPIALRPHLDPEIWRISYHETLSRWTITSEILIATRR